MPINKKSMLSLFQIFIISCFLLPLAVSAHSKACSFDAIYQLGDSISDTGNLIREAPIGTSTAFARLPYGETFFKKPTGRCSNGPLMVDFFASALHLPFLNPYLARDADFSHGVNFAVAGSTALDTSSLAKNKIIPPVTNSSLSVQLGWFKDHLKSICYTSKCAHKLERALFLVGEIGGNDYNYAFFQGKTIGEIQSYVPYIVQKIKDVARKVIDHGARTVVVPGNFPIGCMPIYLTAFRSDDPAAYDELKCLKGLNDLAMIHNDNLQRALKQLRKEYPDVTIVYADYYTALQWVLSHASSLGFEEKSLQKACCGTGGDYNFDLTKMCGAPGVPVCPDPETRVSWDGIHLTEKAYKYMADFLMHSIMPEIQCHI
ncbi:PREDICTED: GDSL esterase/lipase At5g03980-like [Nelumbo nucifera]|uniref:GDSL esterase/lipase At5g03980-like n=1 Tax=Nelumbo nucifera TaxID=4432 RepID=A0A1U8Q0Q1_NELNU|nr:PREDICTED: GDSL esterase/lipase At5g03980-like [Nelumbo nucifera]